MSLLGYNVGTVVADGSEQLVVEVALISKITGYIDLSNLEDGDILTVSQYIKLFEEAEYGLYNEEFYIGKQTEPMVYFTPKELVSGMQVKVTLQQTEGSYKEFAFRFQREVSLDDGRWKIVDNQFVIYEADGTTILRKYDLLDEQGNPTEKAPYERVPT